MKIQTISISGFRCFDEIGQTISIDNLSCFVGPNASGKTAAMIALARLFGETKLQREVLPSDFHLAAGEELRALSPRTLMIECRIVFPELEVDGADLAAIPEIFNQMIVDEPGGTPFCRVRLDATWTNDGTPEGNVDQAIWWILTSSDDPAIIEDNRRRVLPGDRGKIRVIYVPATRDPSHQIRSTTATSFGRLLDALAWGGTEESIKTRLEELQGELASLVGVQTMNTQVQSAWGKLYEGSIAHNVAFQALDKEPTTLVKLLMPTFNPGEDGRSMLASDLSDGLRSLFSISLSLGLFQVEKLLKTTAVEAGFKAEVVEDLPILTVFTVEEPENHLSPHYLGRVVGQLDTISEDSDAQIIISSHSPSILSRIMPDQVRYFLGHETTTASEVKSLPLPSDDTDEAFKYVREAIRGYPELYFSRLIILGEGASEEIVLRRLFEANRAPLDSNFISVVPLGGRHVNHFWRLLHGLGIPFLTLLDLDREKEGAGWGRIQYVRDQLIKRFGVGHEILNFQDSTGNTQNLSNAAYDNLKEKSVTETVEMNAWISLFRIQFDVFFSAPLDLDFSLLEVFPDAYKGLYPPPRGPRLPDPEAPEYSDAINQRMKQVLASDISTAPATLGSTYTMLQQEAFAWYKYLFVDGSKPVIHMRAMLSIDDAQLVISSPDTLRHLIERARVLVSSPPAGVI